MASLGWITLAALLMCGTAMPQQSSGPQAAVAGIANTTKSQVLFCYQTKATSFPGCQASLTAVDLSLATGSWEATNIPSGGATGTVAIYIYTAGVGAGQSAFSAMTCYGQLCIIAFKRSSPACAAITASLTPNSCNPATLALDIACSSGALGLSVGEDVNVQLWYRDVGSACSANFSNAIYYTIL